ncbi:hypothetical protein B4U84_29620 [Westiellopsis prolifica IICB1]|nr:hypothetical protein B4U84_29620 [Westiellopsis prolifica IICB1]
MHQEQDTERISKDKIPEAIKALRELKSKELPDVPAKEAIRQMRRYIEGALKKNYTYDEISELLAGLDIHISGSRLKYLLGEVRKSTRTRKKKKVDAYSETDVEQPEETTVNQGESTTIDRGATESQELTGGESEKKGRRKSQSGQSAKSQPKAQTQSSSESKLQGESHTFKPKLYNPDDL